MTAVKLVVVAALAGALPQQAGGPDFAASLTVEPSEVRLEVGETRSLRVIVTDAGVEHDHGNTGDSTMSFYVIKLR